MKRMLMNKVVFYCICVVMGGLLFTGRFANAADWRFPLGLSYVSGLNDVYNLYKNNLEARGYTVEEKLYWPVGITFQPYVQFENGMGIGAGVGPAMFVGTSETSFTNIPVNMDLRYTFMQGSSTSPYIRAGGRYNIASGDYVKSSSVGFFGGVGIEFARTRPVGAGLEVSYDASEVEFTKYTKRGATYTTGKENIKPGGLMVSVFIIFSSS